MSHRPGRHRQATPALACRRRGVEAGGIEAKGDQEIANGIGAQVCTSAPTAKADPTT